MINSPYSAEWNYGVLPEDRPVGSRVVVVVPDRFVGLMLRVDPVKPQWEGRGVDSTVICQNRWWAFAGTGEAWTPWEELNVWWCEV